MKKFFRKAWLGILALVSVVTGACCTNQNTSGSSEDPNKVNNETQVKPSKKELKNRIEEIRARIQQREMSCVYGSPEIIENYARETQRLRKEADSLQYMLDHYNEIK